MGNAYKVKKLKGRKKWKTENSVRSNNEDLKKTEEKTDGRLEGETI